MTRLKDRPLKDKGHIARKTVWLSFAVLLFIPHVILLSAGWLDEQLLGLGSHLIAWSHPCLYAKRGRSDE